MSGYTLWQLIKSENLKEIESIKPIAEFPRDYWTSANADLCDFLFLPKEKDHQMVGLSWSGLMQTRSAHTNRSVRRNRRHSVNI
jgi:hypothetical protein